MKLLVVYATTEGQTRKIAEQIGDWIQTLGHGSCVLDCALATDETRIDGFDAYVIAGSLHYQKHQRGLVRFVKHNLTLLQRVPTAFVSVSATAVRTDSQSQAEARQCIDAFVRQTGWNPTVSMPIGGAMKYTKYNFILRMILKKISEKNNGPTDTSRDYEFTDWSLLQSFIDRFVANYVDQDGRASKQLQEPAIA